MARIGYIRDINRVDQISDAEKKALEPVADKFKFRANDYYLSLINWDDPKDPIRKIIIPETGELEDFGKLDASNEEAAQSFLEAVER